MKLFGAPDLKGYFVMKKAICMILALTLALSLAACGEKAPQTVNTTLDGTPEQIGQRADLLAKRITAQAAASQTGAGRRPAINYAQPTGGSDPTRTPGHTDWMREALDNNR